MPEMDAGTLGTKHRSGSGTKLRTAPNEDCRSKSRQIPQWIDSNDCVGGELCNSIGQKIVGSCK